MTTILDCLGPLAAAAGMAWAGYGLMELAAGVYGLWARRRVTTGPVRRAGGRG